MLSVIIGNVEIAIEETNTNHPTFEILQEIRYAAERSANLTQQLLAYARKQNTAPKVLDLNEIITNALDMIKPVIGENITLNWKPHAGIWFVKIDPIQVDHILINLCTNARDAIAGPGNLAIETQNSVIREDFCQHHPESIPGEYVMLTVKDDGCGMDQKTVANLFEPFHTTKAFGRNSGLGLATVYGMVKQNNGFIDVTSELDRGSTFKNLSAPAYHGFESITCLSFSARSCSAKGF